MFGRKLEETMVVEARLGGEYVPILVHRCAKFILEHGKVQIFIVMSTCCVRAHDQWWL